MFRATIGPAILLPIFHAVGIFLMTRLFPDYVHPRRTEVVRDRLGLARSLQPSGPISLLVVMVLGGIYAAVFTPTETGAAGDALAFLVMVGKGRFSRAGVWRALLDSARITASILFLVICATMYSRLLDVTGMPYLLTRWIAQLDMSFTALMVIYCMLLIALG